jgi:hypothetical protein
MAQLGHADPKVTLTIYAHVLRRQGDTGKRMDALVRGSDWARSGKIAAQRGDRSLDLGGPGAGNPASQVGSDESRRRGSNPRPPDYKAGEQEDG